MGGEVRGVLKVLRQGDTPSPLRPSRRPGGGPALLLLLLLLLARAGRGGGQAGPGGPADPVADEARPEAIAGEQFLDAIYADQGRGLAENAEEELGDTLVQALNSGANDLLRDWVTDPEGIDVLTRYLQRLGTEAVEAGESWNGSASGSGDQYTAAAAAFAVTVAKNGTLWQETLKPLLVRYAGIDIDWALGRDDLPAERQILGNIYDSTGGAHWVNWLDLNREMVQYEVALHSLFVSDQLIAEAVSEAYPQGLSEADAAVQMLRVKQGVLWMMLHFHDIGHGLPWLTPDSSYCLWRGIHCCVPYEFTDVLAGAVAGDTLPPFKVLTFAPTTNMINPGQFGLLLTAFSVGIDMMIQYSCDKPSSTMLINLPYANMTGYLPPDVGNLTHLQWFMVQYNPFLSGPLPESLGNAACLAGGDARETGMRCSDSSALEYEAFEQEACPAIASWREGLPEYDQHRFFVSQRGAVGWGTLDAYGHCPIPTFLQDTAGMAPVLDYPERCKAEDASVWCPQFQTVEPIATACRRRRYEHHEQQMELLQNDTDGDVQAGNSSSYEEFLGTRLDELAMRGRLARGNFGLSPAYTSWSGCACKADAGFTATAVHKEVVSSGPSDPMHSLVTCKVRPIDDDDHFIRNTLSVCAALLVLVLLAFIFRRQITGFVHDRRRQKAKSRCPPGLPRGASKFLREYMANVYLESDFIDGQSVNQLGAADEQNFPVVAVCARLERPDGVPDGDWEKATHLFRAKVHACMKPIWGHEALNFRHSPDARVIVFHEPLESLIYSIVLHLQCLSVEWPETLQDTALAEAKEFGYAKGRNDAHRVLFHGPRVKCGVAMGLPEEGSGRGPWNFKHGHGTGVFVGPMVTNAKRICEAAAGGQILIEAGVFSFLNGQLNEISELVQLKDRVLSRSLWTLAAEYFKILSRRIKRPRPGAAPETARLDHIVSEGHFHGSEVGDMSTSTRSTQSDTGYGTAPALTARGPAREAALSDSDRPWGFPIVVDMGEYLLRDGGAGGPESGSHGALDPGQRFSLVQVLPRCLAERWLRMPRHISGAEQVELGFFDAPAAADSVATLFREAGSSSSFSAVNSLASALGEADRLQTAPATRAELPEICMVFTGAEGLQDLQMLDFELEEAAQQCFALCVRCSAKAAGGYICQEMDGSFMLYFPSAVEAVNYCMTLQFALLRADWDPRIDVLKPTERIEVDGKLLFRGVRARCGVFKGFPNAIVPHSTTGRADVFGRLVNRAARFHVTAHGGQVLTSSEVLADLEAHWAASPEPRRPDAPPAEEAASSSDEEGADGSDDGSDDEGLASVLSGESVCHIDLRIGSHQAMRIVAKDIGKFRLKGVTTTYRLINVGPRTLARREQYLPKRPKAGKSVRLKKGRGVVANLTIEAPFPMDAEDIHMLRIPHFPDLGVSAASHGKYCAAEVDKSHRHLTSSVRSASAESVRGGPA